MHVSSHCVHHDQVDSHGAQAHMPTYIQESGARTPLSHLRILGAYCFQQCLILIHYSLLDGRLLHCISQTVLRMVPFAMRVYMPC